MSDNQIFAISEHPDTARRLILDGRAREGMVIGGELELHGHSGELSLPESLVVDGDLVCSGCRDLAELPNGLCVRGHAVLNGCFSLRELPDDLRVCGDLILSDCIDLVELPEALHVPGHLYLDDCFSLRELPCGLRVGGYIHAWRVNLKQVPSDIVCRGIDCDDADSSTRLKIVPVSALRSQPSPFLDLTSYC